MDFEIDRAAALMRRGAPLVHDLPGRIGWEIRLTVQGGLRILGEVRTSFAPTVGAFMARVHADDQADVEERLRRPTLRCSALQRAWALRWRDGAVAVDLR